MRKREKEEEEEECCVCMDRPVQVRFVPCNHRALCRPCTDRLDSFDDRRCPLCRATVEQVVDLPRKKRKLQVEPSEQAAARFRDGSGRRWLTQQQVFGELMAIHDQLKTQPTFANSSPTKKVQDMTARAAFKYCNITAVVVQDFFRAWDVCNYLFEITPNAGSFENGLYLAQYFPKLNSLALSGANLNNNAAKRLAELLERRKTLLTSLRELDVSRNTIQVDGLLKLVNHFVLDQDRPPVFPFTLNWAEQNHSSSCFDFASLRSQINLSPSTSHGLIEVQERVFRVSGIESPREGVESQGTMPP